MAITSLRRRSVDSADSRVCVKDGAVLGGIEEHRLKLALRSQLAQHHAHARRLGTHCVEGLPPEHEQDAARRLRGALEPRVGGLVPVAPRLRTLPERSDGPGGKRHSVPTVDFYEAIR